MRVIRRFVFDGSLTGGSRILQGDIAERLWVRGLPVRRVDANAAARLVRRHLDHGPTDPIRALEQAGFWT